MNKSYSYDSFLYGVVYYPEQWPEAQWDSDLSSESVQTGMNVVRMGEGAWSVWEPEEGRYDFALFDRALELCQKHGLKAIMGTPTYTPPAWLTERYPEVLRASFDGTLLRHGSRRHYNYTSPVYREKSRAITEVLANHYRDHPVVIGWQIDNELNCHLDVSFAESDHEAFRAWCQERYVTLEALNNAWGTAFWSQTYSAWEQVWLPRPTVTYQNPSLLLDFYRFTSDMTIRFGAMQYEIIKRIAPHQFVTHNAFQDMTNVDLQEFVRKAVDFVSYDSYPEFRVCDLTLPRLFRDRFESRLLSRMRGVSSKFMVLGTAIGSKRSDRRYPERQPGLPSPDAAARADAPLVLELDRQRGRRHRILSLAFAALRRRSPLERPPLPRRAKHVASGGSPTARPGNQAFIRDIDRYPLCFACGDLVRLRQRVSCENRARYRPAAGGQRTCGLPGARGKAYLRRRSGPVEPSE